MTSTDRSTGRIIDADRRSARVATPGGHGWVRWTARMKDAFLDELAATCHVADSAAAIGFLPGSVYTLRRRDEEFAAAWQTALAQGYEMLETQLVGHALSGGGPAITNGDPARPPIDVELAIKLLNDYGNRALGRRAVRDGRPGRVATREETNAAILKKLKAIEARVAARVGSEEGAGDGRPGAAGSSDGASPRRPASSTTRISGADPLTSA